MQLAVFFGASFLVIGAAQEAPPIAKHVGTELVPPQEIASPMQIEVSMAATPKRKSVQDMDAMHAWVATESANYTCQTARVRLIQIWKEDNRGKVRLRIIPDLMTEQRRQDLDVTVSVVSDSKEVRRNFAANLTIGDDHSTANKLAALTLWAAAAGSTSKSPEVDFEFTKEEFAALWGPDRAPSVRVVLNVKIDG